MNSAQFLPFLSLFEPFDFREPTSMHTPCISLNRFQSMPRHADHNFLYDTRYGRGRLLAARGRVRRWKNCGCGGAVPCYDKAVYVKMPLFVASVSIFTEIVWRETCAVDLSGQIIPCLLTVLRISGFHSPVIVCTSWPIRILVQVNPFWASGLRSQ